ncbi:hypothetical protein F5I97DRAFT_666713 [Phlebopus sp. FC_14]|nr:hypothetical protein F5I97DRAFT_666713 [Phlebopus sp. FC_14]
MSLKASSLTATAFSVIFAFLACGGCVLATSCATCPGDTHLQYVKFFDKCYISYQGVTTCNYMDTRANKEDQCVYSVRRESQVLGQKLDQRPNGCGHRKLASCFSVTLQRESAVRASTLIVPTVQHADTVTSSDVLAGVASMMDVGVVSRPTTVQGCFGSRSSFEARFLDQSYFLSPTA